MDPPTQVVRHVRLGVLKGLIKKEKDKRVFQRLLFIHHLYLGDSVEEACERLCVSNQTGYNWLREWNKQGYEGIKPRRRNGRPPKLTGQQREDLKQHLESKDNWLTAEVRALVKREYGVEYSLRQVIRILRGFNMYYAKPYPHDYRRPDDAVELLASSLSEAVNAAPSDSVLGFLDQSAPQTTDNKQRFWSFTKPRRSVNTTKIRANTFGFYPLNGREVVEFMEDSTSRCVQRFLHLIRDKNPGRHIILILDNARSHIARATRVFAEKLDMTLVFLPPYSPDLNPIEGIWKSIRRKISQIFARSEWAFKETIRTTFHRLAKKPSFAQGWLKTFQPILSTMLGSCLKLRKSAKGGNEL